MSTDMLRAKTDLSDPDLPDPYNFPGSVFGFVYKIGLDPDRHQMLRIRIQQKNPLKTDKSHN